MINIYVLVVVEVWDFLSLSLDATDPLAKLARSNVRIK